jgi:hypothetical protein
MNIRAHIDIDAPEYAAKNYPTEPFNLRPTGEIRGGKVVRTVQENVQRRKSQCEIWNVLDAAQANAVEDIYKGWTQTSPGSHIKGMNMLCVRVDGSRRPIDLTTGIDFRDRYIKWRESCNADKVLRASVALVIAVFCEDKSLRAAERVARIRNGTALDIIRDSIDIYIDRNGAR